MNNSLPKIVAHRGYAKKYPENTRLSITEAFKSGACFVEIDIQCLKDGTVVIYHDQNMKRVSNVDLDILDLTRDEVALYTASEQSRFGDQFKDNKISFLSEMVDVLAQYKDGKLLVELKDESLFLFGISTVVDNVYQELKSVWDQIIIISYNIESLKYTREKYHCQTGWVLTKWDDFSHNIADQFKPEFIITNYKKINFDNGGLWHGPWQWVTYEVIDPEFAVELFDKGILYIESMDIGSLMNSNKFKSAACEHK